MTFCWFVFYFLMACWRKHLYDYSKRAQKSAFVSEGIDCVFMIQHNTAS